MMVLRQRRGHELATADEVDDVRLEKGKKKRRAWSRRQLRRSHHTGDREFVFPAGELDALWQPLAKR